jgi:hypothetical protein
VRDTAPAVSPRKDVRGYALPDGLLVLVIDATKVDKAVSAERWRNLVPGGTYPPIACIQAKTNALAKERVDELIKWVRDNLSIKHVIPMRTLQVLSVEARPSHVDPPQGLERGLQVANNSVCAAGARGRGGRREQRDV